MVTRLPLLVLGFAACDAGDSDPGIGNPTIGNPAAYVVTGRAIDAQGRPLTGAEVVADNQLIHDSNVIGVTDADGAYRIALPEVAVTWKASATLVRDYHGRTYRFDLHPDDVAAFAGNTGAVRNFTWRLRGAKPGTGGFYGGTVLLRLDDLSLNEADVALTLVPDGTLVDGSAGNTVSAHPVVTGDGWGVVDVPVGRYRINAHHAPTGRTMEVKLKGGIDWVSTLTADFDAPFGDLQIYRIDLEARLPQ